MRISDWSSDVCSSDLIEYPAPLAAEDIRRLGFAQPPEAYDPFRLALVLDVVLDWDAEANETSDKSLLVDLVDGLYDEIVRPDPRGITPQVRRRAMARVFGLDLPEPAEHPRRRGRPARDRKSTRLNYSH